MEQEFQKLGIGRLIMEQIIEKANSKKKSIRLQVLKINIKARSFYEKLGFKSINEKENHIEMKKDFF